MAISKKIVTYHGLRLLAEIKPASDGCGVMVTLRVMQVDDCAETEKLKRELEQFAQDYWNDTLGF